MNIHFDYKVMLVYMLRKSKSLERISYKAVDYIKFHAIEKGTINMRETSINVRRK